MNGRIRGLYQKRGFYYWQPPQPNGVKVSAIALRTKDRAEAIIAYETEKRNHELGLAKFRGSMSEAIGLYVEAKKSETSQATNERARTKLPAIASDLKTLVNKTKLSSINKRDIVEWRKSLSKRDGYNASKLSNSTITTYLTMLKAFFNWCVEEGLITSSPLLGIKIPKPKKISPTKFCTKDQRDLLLKNPPNEDISFILHMGFYAGLRFGEINAIKSDWITYSDDRTRATITVQEEEGVWKPKDGHLRTIPIPPSLMSFLDSYGKKEGYMFAPHNKTWGKKYRYNPKKTFKTHAENNGLGFVTYHVLRASFATHLSEALKPISFIAGLLGDDITTTEKHYIGFPQPTDDSTDCLE